IVASVARPGGNITGSSVFYDEINAKRVELLKDLMPPLEHVGVLVNPDNPANDSVMRVARQTAKTLNVMLQPVNVRRVEELEALFERCKAGGLAAYGVDFPQIWRSAGVFVDKILKGKKPADLPIEQATRFEFMINMKTAKALSFDVPPAMSALASTVI